MEFTTGTYINMYGNGRDILVAICEANGKVTNKQILDAQNLIEGFDYEQQRWKIKLECEMEKIFPYGVSTYALR